MPPVRRRLKFWAGRVGVGIGGFCCNNAVHMCCAEAEVLEQLVLEGEESTGEGPASFHVFAVFVSGGLVREKCGNGVVGVSEGVIVVCEGGGGMSLSFCLAEEGFSSSCHRGEHGEREEPFEGSQ